MGSWLGRESQIKAQTFDPQEAPGSLPTYRLTSCSFLLSAATALSGLGTDSRKGVLLSPLLPLPHGPQEVRGHQLRVWMSDMVYAHRAGSLSLSTTEVLPWMP